MCETNSNRMSALLSLWSSIAFTKVLKEHARAFKRHKADDTRISVVNDSAAHAFSMSNVSKVAVTPLFTPGS